MTTKKRPRSDRLNAVLDAIRSAASAKRGCWFFQLADEDREIVRTAVAGKMTGKTRISWAELHSILCTAGIDMPTCRTFQDNCLELRKEFTDAQV